MMIEGKQGEEILERKGDRGNQADVMFEEEMRRLRRFWFHRKRDIYCQLFQLLFLFEKEQDETYIGYHPLRPNCCSVGTFRK